jgi:hypothetical protein
VRSVSGNSSLSECSIVDKAPRHGAGVEAVDHAARNAERLARADVGLLSIQRQSEHPSEPVDRLLVTVMTVRRRYLRSGRNVELENGDGPSRRLAFEQESNRQTPDSDLFAFARQSDRLPAVIGLCRI